MTNPPQGGFSGAGKMTIVLGGAGGWPSTTSGCASPAKTEMTTNKQNIQTLDFDAATQEYAEWTAFMPDNYDGGALKARFIWTAAGGTAAQNVIWGVQARSYGDDDALDQAFGTAVEVTDALLAVSDVHISGESADMTPGGTPAGGKLMHFRVYRKAADAGDTLTVDAKLLAVKLEYGVSSYSA